MEEKQLQKKKFRNIIFLGLVSCFADISSEMVYPLIPLYLTAVLGATPVLVGIIEGIAESIASLLKVFSGYISDKYNRKKPIAFAGYASGLLYKLALLFAGSWAGILAARIIDRFGKGIRTAPRDVMVAENADKSRMGKSFGIHKALDMTGSAIGILLSFILLKNLGTNEMCIRDSLCFCSCWWQQPSTSCWANPVPAASCSSSWWASSASMCFRSGRQIRP